VIPWELRHGMVMKNDSERAQWKESLSPQGSPHANVDVCFFCTRIYQVGTQPALLISATRVWTSWQLSVMLAWWQGTMITAEGLHAQVAHPVALFC
jgi:hypothetical protein